MEKTRLNRALENHLVAYIPLERCGEPEEVAKLIILLSGDDAPFIRVGTILLTVDNRFEELRLNK